VGEGARVGLVSKDLESVFPHLIGSSYAITSPSTPEYNCIAWAAGDSERWWWPVAGSFAYWPPNIPLQESLDAFIKAFGSIGFTPCGNANIEQGYEKIALYVDSNGKPTHAARQLPNGRWTSKLGKIEDIEHELDGLTGSVYGTVAQILKRPINE
jgi:hypothetical protein